MKEAILIASFGSTHLDTLEETVFALEKNIQAAYPQLPCFRAFTSGIVRRRLRERQGLEVPSVGEALRQLEAQGFERVTLQPTLLLPGEEFDRLRREALEAAGSLQVTVGRPLLWDDSDLTALANILAEAYPQPADSLLLLMGHGSSHGADQLYQRLRAILQAQGMELCTVEGSITFEDAVEALLRQPKRKVQLLPLLLVAGDHAKNDMSGDGDDSLKSRLEAAGFEVQCILRGLGQLPAVRQLYCRRVEQARA